MHAAQVYLPKNLDQARTVMREHGGERGDVALPVYKAGGLDLVDLMKEGIAEPETIINLRGLDAKELHAIDHESIGALCTLSEIASSEKMRKFAPVVAQAAADAATPQVRNVATAAGNLLQRPRCWYFRSEQFDCLKKSGHMCYAVEGESRYHAIFGDGPCHIVHPSNLANALSVCDAVVETSRADGSTREVAMRDLYKMPSEQVRKEHTLEPDEIITRIYYMAKPFSAHYEVREKQSFDWPLVMASVSFSDFDGERVTGPQVCVGGVAPVPWRLRTVEKALSEMSSIDDEQWLRHACGLSKAGATPLRDNAYKLDLMPVAIYRAVKKACGKPVDHLFADRGAH
ncbi:MAG: FAD binding domain-containing protein [Phycisphaerales bacterium]